MEAIYGVLAAIIAILSTLLVWGGGICFTVSVICCLLKLIGVAVVSGVSYWAPVWALGGVITGYVGAFISCLLTTMAVVK